RLWNACTATGIAPKDYAKPFDTITVCLSKALGAPVGSVIASSRELIAKARRRRKQLGGGMRQVGILASAGIYALEHHLELLKQDHENAKLFAQCIAQSEQILISLENVETNIVIFRLSDKIEQLEFIQKCQDSGLRIIPMGGGLIRAVFHFQISREDTKKAIEIILQATK
ncbi:MAG: beta-eliminating lyase-related protein, partial [Bacteroidota bacterium]